MDRSAAVLCSMTSVLFDVKDKVHNPVRTAERQYNPVVFQHKQP